MDGVGKSTLVKKLSKAFEFDFVERPMRKFLNMTDSDYNDFCNHIWSMDNKDLTLVFFMLGNLTTRYYGENIIADRHILSSYYWDGNEENKNIFNYFCKGDIIPDLTFVLYANEETRYERIKKRNANDSDLKDSIVMNFGYDKMIEFANEINLPYILINTEKMDEMETFKYCSNILLELIKNNNINDKERIINSYNNYFFENKKSDKILSLRKNMIQYTWK